MMQPIPAQIVPVPLRAAMLDEGADPKQVPPGTLERLSNCVWRKAGRVEKRPGTFAYATSLIGGGSITSPLQKIWSRGSEIIATDGVFLYTWIPAQSKWRRRHEMPALEATWTTLIDTARSIPAADIDVTSDYRVSVWAASNSLFVQVENAGGRVVAPAELPTGGVIVRAFRTLVSGTTALVLWQEDSSNTIKVVSLDLTTAIDSASLDGVTPTSLKTDVTASAEPLWDVVHNGANWTLVYKTTGNVLRLYTYNYSLTQQATGDVVTSAAIVAAAIHATVGESLYVAYAESGTFPVKLAVHNPSTLAQTTASTTLYSAASSVVAISVVRTSSTSCVVASTEFTATDLYYATKTISASSTAVADANSARLTRWAKLANKLFVLGGRTYATLTSARPSLVSTNPNVTQNTTFVVEVETTSAGWMVGVLPHPVAAVIDPNVSAPADVSYQLCSTPVVGTEVYGTSKFISSPGRNGLRIVTLSTALTVPWAASPLAHTLVMAGAVSRVYDGRRAFEIGFLNPPRVLAATAGTSGSMAAGTYLYVFVYEWRDATGLLHRSAPSQPTSVTVAASGSVAFRLECATSSGKTDLSTGAGVSSGVGVPNAQQVLIIPYRTTVGGTTYYRRVRESTGSGSVVNDALVKDVSWTDTGSDTSFDGSGTYLAQQPVLYTTGGYLDEVAPPGFTMTLPHRGRIFGVSGDRRTVWCSKAFAEDPSVFPGFHENLRILCDEDITAIASLDDKLVIFSEESIFVVYGDGPNAAGVGSFEVPIVVQSDVGAISARSVVETPDGIMFLSRRGLYVLTRGLEVKWIGREVRDQLDTYPIPLDARLVPHRNQVRFSMWDGTTSGVVLVFDYVNRFWSVFNYHDGAVASGPIRSSFVNAGVLYFTNVASLVKEDDTTHLDRGATWVTLDFELTFIPFGPIAWQHVRRVHLLGEKRTNHDLRLRFAFDHRATYSQDVTFTAEAIAQNNDCPTVRIGSQNGANPKSKALRVRVTDATPTNPGTYPVSTGEGGWFSAVALELIPKPGLPRHGARLSKV